MQQFNTLLVTATAPSTLPQTGTLRQNFDAKTKNRQLVRNCAVSGTHAQMAAAVVV